MTINVTTSWMDIIQPGLYGTLLGSYDIREENWNEYEQYVADQTAKAIEELTGYKCSNAVMKSPMWYNYSNDSVEFDMEIPDDIMKEMEDIPEEGWIYFNKHFGSHPGCISSMPYTKEKFEIAIHDMRGNWDFEMAVCMYLSWKYRDENIQEDFEDDVIEYVCGNTSWVIDEEEMED